MANSSNDRQPATINLSSEARIASAIAGAALLLPALKRASRGRVALAVAGAALLQRGLTGYCGLYRALGISSARRADAPEAAKAPEAECDPVSQTSEDSFPASDPPSWTPARRSVAARR